MKPLNLFFLFFSFSYSLKIFAANRPQDSSLYEKHTKYVKEQHRLISKTLKRIHKKTKSDSLSRFESIKLDYEKKCSRFSYLHKKNKVSITDGYNQSMFHIGIIEQTLRKIKSATQKEVTQRRLNINTLKALQKESVYGQAKNKYLKQVKYKDLLSKIKFNRLEQLKRMQQNVVMKIKPPANLSSVKGNFAPPKFEFPLGVQTLSETNQVLQAKSSGDGPTLGEKYSKAINSPLSTLIDSNSFNVKDTLLFRPNPYKAMPFAARIKLGFDNQINNINSGGKLISYTINIRYLLAPKVTPTIGIGYGHSVIKSGDKINLKSEHIQLRLGVESKIYKSIGGFVNAELTNPININTKRKMSNDFVIGFTNFNGEKSKLKIWLGLSVYNLIEGNSNPFIFRIGL
jgi:hypothetical protein